MFLMMTDAQERWLRREEVKVDLMHIAGWMLTGSMWIFLALVAIKTFVVYGLLAALGWSVIAVLLGLFPFLWMNLRMVMRRRARKGTEQGSV
jgi:hypothetical protein